MNRFHTLRSSVSFCAALIVSVTAFPPARASEPEGVVPATVFSSAAGQVLRPQGPYLTVTNFTEAGLVEARIYRDSGHISLVGPDLAGNPLANAITLTPPLVKISGHWYSLGRILSSTAVGNGLEVVQQLSTTSVVARLTFAAEGVMRYEVVNWGGLPVEATAVAAASDTSEHFYGFGEKFNDFDQAGKRVRILTFDKAGDKQDSSYKVAPWFISTRGYGFHLDSSAESWFDMRAARLDRYVVEDLFPSLKFNVVYGPKLTEVLARYTGYTGRPPTPPPWAFAPWLSSDIWRTGGEVRYVVTKYRQLGIPGSVFVFDSPWETAYNDFNWNMTQFGADGIYAGIHYAGFGSAADMMTFLRTNGFKVVCWMTPLINTDSTGHGKVAGQNLGPSSNYAEAAVNNYLVRAAPGGPPLIVNWWKGAGSPIDFTNPNARRWLTEQLRNLIAQSGGVIGGFKTDDGESGSSDGNTYIPTNAIYEDGRTGVEMRNGYAPVYERTIWNVLGTNGILWARSGFTGSQAYPACWAGDNQPNFGANGLAGVVVAGQSAAMSGFAIWGSDIGGYQDGARIWSSTPANLFERWTQFGALSPIMQMHRQVTSNRQYPWSFGNEGTSNYLFYAQLHTALFPYLYTYAQQCSTDGLPIIRPLVLMNQTDTNTYGLRHTYLLGDDLLVAAVITNLANSRTVYLPDGNWYDFFTQQKFAGGRNVTWTNADQTKMPLFAREGAIIPMISTNVATLCNAAYVGNPAVATWDGSLQFLVYPTANSSFTVYDGTRLQCGTKGAVTTLSLSSKARSVTMKILSAQPLRVERNGMPLAQFTDSIGVAQADQGWQYGAPFVLVKLNHAGGSARIVLQGNSSTR
jgi:alpha-D-xyloside xylohydrolase